MGKDNRILIAAEDGAETAVDSVDGVTIEFRGNNSTVVLAEGSVFVNARLQLGNQCTVQIGKTHARGLRNLGIDMTGAGRNRLLRIGEGCSCESLRFAMANESNLSVTLGRNCLISSNVTVRPTDGHAIYELTSRRIVNRGRPITIADNVWIGAGVTFLKGAAVGANSVVGTGAIVAGQFDDENVVIAGCPAKIVRSGIMWDRRYIDQFAAADYRVPE